MRKHAHFDVTSGGSFAMLLGACFDLYAKMNDNNILEDLSERLRRRMRRAVEQNVKCSCPSLAIQTVSQVWSKSTVVDFLHEQDSKNMTENFLSFEEFETHLVTLELNSTTVKRASKVAVEMDRAHKMATGDTLAGRTGDYFLVHRNEMVEMLWFLSALEELVVESFSCSALPAMTDRPLEPQPSSDSETPTTPSPYIVDELLLGMRVFQPQGDQGVEMSPMLIATLKSLSVGEKRPDPFLPTGIGYGQSLPATGRPCRVLVGESVSSIAAAIPAAPRAETMTHLEANLDDTTGESLALAIELLLATGAVDAWVTPIVMKKGRPAHTLHCLSHSDSTIVDSLLGVMFRQTTTLGVRVNRNVERVALTRKMTNISWKDDEGTERNTRLKIGFYQGAVVSVKPEFEDLKEVVIETGMPIKETSDRVIAEAHKELGYSSSNSQMAFRPSRYE